VLLKGSLIAIVETIQRLWFVSTILAIYKFVCMYVCMYVTNCGRFVLFRKSYRVIGDFLPRQEVIFRPPFVCLSFCLFVCPQDNSKTTALVQKLICGRHTKFCDHYKIILWLFTYKKYLFLSRNNFVNVISLQLQNLFCKTSNAFWLYLTKNFVYITLSTESG